MIFFHIKPIVHKHYMPIHTKQFQTILQKK